MQCQGLSSSGTAYLSFDQVRVPTRHLIGKEGDGFRMIMYNFNHERWAMTIMANRLARVALAESFKCVAAFSAGRKCLCLSMW